MKCMEENILIVCYSYSGKTRRIAEMIQEQTGGQIQPDLSETALSIGF